MKRILHVIDSLGRGGAETLLVNTIMSLDEYEHIVVTVFNKNEFQQELQSKSNISIVSLHAKSIKQLFFKISQLKKIVKHYHPDIVHSQLYWSSVLARICTPKSIKFFYTNQSLQSNEAFRQKWTVYLEKLTYAPRHTLISVSTAVEEEYKDYIGIKGKHYILRNFADDIFFKGVKTFPTTEGQYKFITVGRLHQQKNQLLLVDGFSEMPSNYTLSIYGKGPLEEELKNVARGRNTGNIYFEGVKSKMDMHYPAYDVFIMASFYEGFSLAVVEAMASGLPVLLPDLPVFHEMAGDAGFYYSISDVTDLRRKIKAICLPECLKELSFRSVAQAEKIGRKDQYLRQLRSLYES